MAQQKCPIYRIKHGQGFTMLDPIDRIKHGKTLSMLDPIDRTFLLCHCFVLVVLSSFCPRVPLCMGLLSTLCCVLALLPRFLASASGMSACSVFPMGVLEGLEIVVVTLRTDIDRAP